MTNKCNAKITGRIRSRKYRSLAEERPDLLEEWVYKKNQNLDPNLLAAGSEKRAVWKCKKCGQEWTAMIASRATRNTGCPVCAGHVVVAGINDLASRYPQIAAEWNYDRNGDLRPDRVTYGSKKKVWWICQNGHEWEATITSRTTNGSGCPYDAGKKVLPGFNDLKSQREDIAAEWNYTRNKGLTPDQFTVHSGKKVWWICRLGHEWEASIYSRTSKIKPTGCPYCAGRKVLAGFNDLKSQNPDIAREWDWKKNAPLRPDQVTVCSGKSVHWICGYGHEWKATIINRTKNNSGCSVCANMKVIPGVNDLASLRPDLAAEWHPEKNGELTSDQVPVGSDKKVWWLCRNGHEWKTAVYHRTTDGSGCPDCRRKRWAKSTNPLVEILWDEERNGPLSDEIKISSSAWFRCPVCGERWISTIVAVIDGHNMCPNFAKHDYHY